MTRPLPLLDDEDRSEAERLDRGFGALATARGHLPLKAMSIEGRIDGLLAQVVLRQTFVNGTDEALEATYIFPLPDRAAVLGFRMVVNGRVIDGLLEERGKARRDYEAALDEGRRASIAEEERPGVFTLRAGNLMPGEEAQIEFTMAGVLPYQDGEVTFRFPLVVAPRYIPGTPLPGDPVGDGQAIDTDAVPDASRISPPVLLPGFRDPVRLSLTIDVHSSGGAVDDLRSSLLGTTTEEIDGAFRVRLNPDARLDRDFVLRFRLGGEGIASALTVHPESVSGGTFALTVIPPAIGPRSARKPRDVMFVLDRSGSMDGWKIVAARRAMARMIDSLAEPDRFGLIAFSGSIQTPKAGPSLVPAGDRQRFAAVEFLADLGADGGTEMAPALVAAARELARNDPGRDRLLVLVTDGQIGNEDQVLRSLAPMLEGVRVFALGIDLAVNEGFLHRLAGLGGGSCEIVESEDRLDEVLDTIRRRIGPPVLSDLRLEAIGGEIEADSVVPGGRLHLVPGVPALILGRFLGRPPGSIAVAALDGRGEPWREQVPGSIRTNPAVASAWARLKVRELEDRFAIGREDRRALERTIVETSLKYGVLCRFTAFVAIDRSQTVNPGGRVLRVTQPVEAPAEASLVTRTMPRYRAPESSASFLSSPSRALGGGGSLLDFGIARFLDAFLPAPAASPRSAPPPSTPPPSVPTTNSSSLGDTIDDFDSIRPASQEPAPKISGRIDRSVPPLPRFDRLEVVGRGGIGTKYKGFDPSRGFEVEIRSYPRPADPSVESSLIRRVELLSKDNLPGLMPILEVIPGDGCLFLVSRHLPWPSLADLLEGGKRLEPARAADIVARLAEIVHSCHVRGLIHGNLKTRNVLIGEDGSVMLSGFAPFLSPEGMISGTPHYIAPEVWKGGTAQSVSNDMFALGVILFTTLTGDWPFPGSSPMEICKSIMVGEARPARQVHPAVPSDLEEVCKKALVSDPSRRYATAKELADDLRKYSPPLPVEGLLQKAGRFLSGRKPAPREGFWKEPPA